MKKIYVSEILLTSSFVTPDSWLCFFNTIAKLNGYFHTFSIYTKITLNEVHFFLASRHPIPQILSSLGDFLLKPVSLDEITFDSFSSFFPLYCITNKEKNLLDVLDRIESKSGKTLVGSKMTFFGYKKDHFFTKTELFLASGKNSLLKKKLALFAIPHEFFSIDFSIYTRFFYRKNAGKYLNIQKVLPVFRPKNTNSFLQVDTFPYMKDTYFLDPFSYDFQKHSVIIGSSGTGKSKLVSSFLAKIYQNAKIIVIDPHASLEKDIGGIGVTLDFKSADTSCNLFMESNQIDQIASVELMLSLFQTLMQDQYNAKLERVLRHSIHLLQEYHNLNFANLRKLLQNIEYRNQLIESQKKNLADSIINFFYTDFNELKSKSYSEAIAPIIAFLDEMELLPVFQEKYQMPEIKDFILQNNLTIFSLDQTILGEKVTKTISGLVMQQLWELVKSHTFREHIILVVDEVSVIENPILARLLSEARKYNLSVILIQQYFGQISEHLQKSIFANVSNFYVFRVSKSDALVLENNLQMEVAVRDSYKVRIKLLTELKNRECIVRICKDGVLFPAFKARTLDFVPIPRKTQNQILQSPPTSTFSPSLKIEDSPFSFDITEDRWIFFKSVLCYLNQVVESW